MSLLLRICSPFFYFLVLFVAMILAIGLIDPSVKIIGGYTFFGNRDINLAITGLFSGFTLFAMMSLAIKSVWVKSGSPLWGHFWRCCPLYVIAVFAGLGILSFTYPTYRNPGIGGAWVAAAFFSSVAGILADCIFSRAPRGQKQGTT